jgi:hypothetical protein
MTDQFLRTSVRRLFAAGLREHEIRERLGTSQIWTRHALTSAIHREPALESMHYINRHKRGRLATARIVNEDPVCELVNRYDR